jgi:hypothetical protein
VWASTLLYAGTFGLPESVAYFAAADPSRRAVVWSTAQLAAGALGHAVTAIGGVILPLVFAGPANAALAGWMQWYLLLFAVPCLLSLAACSWLQGVGRTGAFNVSRATVHVVNAAGFGLLWVAGDGLVWHFACALLVGNAATWLLATALGPRVPPFPGFRAAHVQLRFPGPGRELVECRKRPARSVAAFAARHAGFARGLCRCGHLRQCRLDASRVGRTRDAAADRQ